MKASRVQVYDPPMCCSSGVCGPDVNPELARFSSDLEWLRQQGVEVERYNLSSHPAAFVRQEAVREALSAEGTDCLPVIVVDGLIVSKGIYPTRSDLMKLSGIDGQNGRAEGIPAAASSVELKNEAAACGPGCSCGAPSGGRRMKTAVSLVVLLAVGGILAYKASSARENASNDVAAKGDAAFAVAQPAPNSMPGVAEQSSSVTQQDMAKNSAVSGDKSIAKNDAAPAKGSRKIGEYLESFSALNEVASKQDAVFVYVPARNDEPVDSKTNDAVLAAQEALKSNKVALGLYTLSTSSPDYLAITAQVQAPAILVSVKGKGMSTISGDVTETKLLQAFTASSRAGGCCPSGSGAAACK